MNNIRMIILDRDGVINEDSDDFIRSPEAFVPIPGSLKAIADLNNAGFVIGVATNQSGVARGYYDLQTLDAIHEKMHKQLKENGAKVDSLRSCPHIHYDCDCRKPKPGMLLDLMETHQLKPEQTIMVGDSLRDIEAGIAAGCAHTVLLKTGKGKRTLHNKPHLAEGLVFDNLADFVKALLDGKLKTR
jgi:D-glycero-D-manno-heptose 1,7-bisphosphate phosphatase